MANHTTTLASRPPSPDESQAALATLLRALRDGRPVDESSMRDAVRAYVHYLRAAHVPPERVIIDIKAIARRNGVPSSRHDDSTLSSGSEGLMSRLVRCCIAEYYRTD